MTLRMEDALNGWQEDPAPDWRFYVVFPTLDQAVSMPDGFQPIFSLNDRIYVESIPVNNINITATPRFYGGRNRHYPHFGEIQAFSLTMHESANYNVLRYLLTWQYSMINPDGMTYQIAQIYKKNISVLAYSIIDDRNPVYQHDYEDCWPSDIQPIEYSYANSTGVKITCTFATDNGRPRFFPRDLDTTNPTGAISSSANNH